MARQSYAYRKNDASAAAPTGAVSRVLQERRQDSPQGAWTGGAGLRPGSVPCGGGSGAQDRDRVLVHAEAEQQLPHLP